MHSYLVGASLDHRRDVPLRVEHHQMYVERQRRARTYRRDQLPAKGQLRHKVAIHDIYVDGIGPSVSNNIHSGAKNCPIRRQDRGRDQDGWGGGNLASVGVAHGLCSCTVGRRRTAVCN